MTKLVFFGCGNMAQAIISGYLHHGQVNASDIYIYHRSGMPEHLAQLGCISLKKQENGMSPSQKDEFFRNLSAVIFICVKPNQFMGLIDCLNSWLKYSSSVVVSVMAGVTLEKISKSLLPKCYHIRIIRSIPNLAVANGKGVWAWSASSGYDPVVHDGVKNLLSRISFAPFVSEEHLDVICGLSGSGLAYVFYMMDALKKGAIYMGLPEALATEIVKNTVAGAGCLSLSSKKSFSDLCDSICSPGGTTIAGIRALNENKFHHAVLSAVVDATKRGQELNQVGKPETDANKSKIVSPSLNSHQICLLLSRGGLLKNTSDSSSSNLTADPSDASSFPDANSGKSSPSPPVDQISSEMAQQPGNLKTSQDPEPLSENMSHEKSRNKRERYTFRPWQLDILETEFRRNNYPDIDHRERIVDRLNLEHAEKLGRNLKKHEKVNNSIIHTWFSNKRAKRTSRKSDATNRLNQKNLPENSNESVSFEINSFSDEETDSLNRYIVKPEPNEF